MEPGKQFDNYLGGVNWSKYTQRVKQPHQMTPDEFAAHPYAVFHSTDESPEFLNHWGNGAPAQFEGRNYGTFRRHYGTEQASHQIFAGKMVNDDEVRPRIYTYWHEPKPSQVFAGSDVERPELQGLTDDAANEMPRDEHDVADMKVMERNKGGYYKNEHEDEGSISYVSLEPKGVKSQADYVTQAIAKGKEHEVHPITLGLYRAGQLSQPAPISRENAIKTTDLNGMDDYIHEKYWEPQLSGLEDKEGGRFPTPERISDNGPDISKTAEEFLRRKGKR
jgi:hypothetical protein